MQNAAQKWRAHLDPMEGLGGLTSAGKEEVRVLNVRESVPSLLQFEEIALFAWQHRYAKEDGALAFQGRKHKSENAGSVQF